MAVRKELPKNIGIEDEFEMKAMLFDYQNQAGVMASMSILTENVSSVKWPSEWWQAVKKRWFPDILLKVYPVQYIGVDIKALYPHISDPENAILKATPIKGK